VVTLRRTLALLGRPPAEVPSGGADSRNTSLLRSLEPAALRLRIGRLWHPVVAVGVVLPPPPHAVQHDTRHIGPRGPQLRQALLEAVGVELPGIDHEEHGVCL